MQGAAERVAVAAAKHEAALDQRRDHDDAGDHDALIALQGARHLHGAIPAVAFAQQIFG
jgi:hypothetical protein